MLRACSGTTQDDIIDVAGVYSLVQTLPNLRTRYVPNVRSLAGFVRKLLQGILWRETHVLRHYPAIASDFKV